jgi:signal transduction histidine kinase
MNYPPISENELERLLELSSYNLDYSILETQFNDLAKLAATIAGTNISLINLIDSYTQWTVAAHGFPTIQIDKGESVCQYTILENKPMEVTDLSVDKRFSNHFFVKEGPKLRYYFGIPLVTKNGFNLGTLCVLDNKSRVLTPKQVELLKIIANDIVKRLNLLKELEDLKVDMADIRENHKRLAHDIRGPIGGIIGLSRIIGEQGENNDIQEVLEFVKLINQSSKSLLEMADDILVKNFNNITETDSSFEFDLLGLKQKIDDLYAVQARQKEVSLSVHLKGKNEEIPYSKNKLLHILGNLVSNAIKFTPKDGEVEVYLSLSKQHDRTWLLASIKDTGLGMTNQQISDIVSGVSQSKVGTFGEKGYGYGLAVVKHLLDTNQGELKIKSEIGQFTQFLVKLPVG